MFITHINGNKQALVGSRPAAYAAQQKNTVPDCKYTDRLACQAGVAKTISHKKKIIKYVCSVHAIYSPGCLGQPFYSEQPDVTCVSYYMYVYHSGT